MNLVFKNIHSDRYRREQGDLGEIVTSEDEADEWMEKHVELPKYEEEIDVGHFLKMTMRKFEEETMARLPRWRRREMEMFGLGLVPEMWI